MDPESGPPVATEQRSVNDRSLLFWLLFTGSGLVGALGIGGFIVFSFAYSNYTAGMWALSAAIFSFAALHLHVLNLFNHLVLWHDVDSLNQVKFLALGVSTLSTVGTIVFGALAFLMTNEIDFGANNFTISAASAGLSDLSGIVLMLTAIHYKGILQNDVAYRYGVLT